MTEFTNPLQQDEEAMKHASSMNKIYDMLQEIFDREENERRAMNAASMMNEETWVFLRTDLNETQR